MRRIAFGISLVALCTLSVELLLTRVFDVILYPNLGYMIITGAMFAFGLAGIWSTLRPLPEQADVNRRLAVLSGLFAISILLIRPALNVIPFEYTAIAEQPGAQTLYFLLMYLVITVPFFLAGRVFTLAFSHYASEIQTLYFWDLAGAAVGCVIIVPFLPPLGPGGLLYCAAGTGLLATALFLPGQRNLRALAVVGAILCVAYPIWHMPEYLSFREHKSDRGLDAARETGTYELVRWDPISKVEVIELGPSKNIVYDGGSQSSFIYPFDGDYDRLRGFLERAVRLNHEHLVLRHFWQRGVFASYWLKQGTEPNVLIIGSAAGQETKAALTFGAAHVDAVEMVGAVIELGQTVYAAYNGGILNHPRANVVRGEGRSFLRTRNRTYDIIQIFSNHSSSSVAAGVGAMDPTYLLTADAFVEYFQGLSEDGILQVNHHTYPRIITTAALGWKWSGRDDFRDHVVVVAKRDDPTDTLPTILIKMTPWTEEELREVRFFFSIRRLREPLFEVEEDPLAPEESFLSDEFYSGSLPPELTAKIPYRIVPTTDDRPYFKFLRRDFGRIEASRDTFTWRETAYQLNTQLERGGGIPLDVVHLLVTGVVSSVFALLFVLVPLFFSRVGRQPWHGKFPALLYFSCLGAGFILVELVFIQKFMRFIGFPLYTYSTVLFTVLLAAGLGSTLSRNLRIAPRSDRWWWPFAGTILYGVLFLVTHSAIFDALLFLPDWARILVSGVYMFPIGFFMGMCFPLGILSVERVAESAVAWAWGMNGLFTVIGGLASVVLSIYLGFTAALVVALGIYVVAWLAFGSVRMIEPVDV